MFFFHSPTHRFHFEVTKVHRQAILFPVVESRTRKLSGMPNVCTPKHLLLESSKSMKSGTHEVICQFCNVKGMVVESEVLKAQNCALNEFSLPMNSKVFWKQTTASRSSKKHQQKLQGYCVRLWTFST